MEEEPEKDSENARELTDVKGHIRLENVTYGYGDDKNVLDNVSLDIPIGTKYALVGPSGGGKTTICHLSPRFYSIESGSVFIDGHNKNEVTLDSLRKSIGIVQQDVYLFGASIKENILYGKPYATD